MNKIELNNLGIQKLTEQDSFDYCSINNINPENITKLYLNNNNLTDISGIKLFKNLINLYIDSSRLENISVLKYLINLKELYLSNNNIKDISILKYLSELEILNISSNEIRNISAVKNLINLKHLNIQSLLLESNQIKYLKRLKNLKFLYCKNAFKNMDIVNELSSNIKMWI